MGQGLIKIFQKALAYFEQKAYSKYNRFKKEKGEEINMQVSVVFVSEESSIAVN